MLSWQASKGKKLDFVKEVFERPTLARRKPQKPTNRHNKLHKGERRAAVRARASTGTTTTTTPAGAAADKAHKADGISPGEKSAKLSEAISIYEQGVGLLDEVLAQGKVKDAARAQLEKKREEVQKRIAQLRKKLGGSMAEPGSEPEPKP